MKKRVDQGKVFLFVTIILGPALLASAPVPDPAAGPAGNLGPPQIVSSNPPQILAGGTPHVVELDIDGSGLVPPGSTFQTVPVDVVVLVDDGSGWKQGSVVIPGNHGWGVGHLSILTPPVVPKVPSLRIKLRVKGVESNVHTVIVFVQDPPGAPVITAVSPWETVAGSSDYDFILKVFTNGHSGDLYFNGAEITKYVDALTGPSEYYFQFSVPLEARQAPGRYPIQVKSKYGDSPVVYWELVAPPVVVALWPKSLTAAQAAPGAKPVSVTVTFGPCQPKTLWYAIDGGTSWKKIDPVTFFMSSATFSLDVAALHPSHRVAIKLVNAAGETTATLPVQSSLVKPIVLSPVRKK